MNQDRERQHLAQADRHIAELKGRIAQQREIVQRLAPRGQPRKEASERLAILQDSLRIFDHHRRLVLDALKTSG
jgi:hypothetical protein